MRLDLAPEDLSSSIISSSMWRRPAVSSRTGSTRCAAAFSTPRARSRRAAAPRPVDGQLELLAEDAELLDGRRPVDVGRDQERPEALALEVTRELRDARRLAGALEAQDHDDGRRPGRHREPVRAPPSSSTSSPWTILTTCWPGVRLWRSSCPTAFSRTRSTKDRTTLKLTSASRRAMRTSRSASWMFFSVRRPAPRRRSKIASRRCVRASNIGSSRNLVGKSRKALKTTGHPRRRQGSPPRSWPEMRR